MRCIRAIAFLLVVVLTMRPAEAQEMLNLPELPGLIAYVGTDFNIYTIDGSDGTVSALTDDAGPREDSIYVYQWPTWSTDGRLAYFALDLTQAGQVLTTDTYVSDNGREPGERVYTWEDQVFNYAYWAPQNCDAGANCRDLAVLLGDATGLIVELVRDTETGATSQTAGAGAPFYFSWSPDATRMLWQRNRTRLDIYDVSAADVTETLAQTPGFFAAPAWSPVDDRMLIGVLNAETENTDLILLANNETRTLASDLEGQVSFSWSPDGNRVAYTAQQGPVFVLDTVTGETVARSPVTGVYAFFWSPDSRQIGYVTLAAPPGSFSAGNMSGPGQAALAQGQPGLALSVLDVQSGADRRLATFFPTRDMLYYLAYFDQFAQSHRLWSPDSRRLIYGEVTGGNRSVVTMVDVSGEAPVPLSIAEGTIGVWSFE